MHLRHLDPLGGGGGGLHTSGTLTTVRESLFQRGSLQSSFMPHASTAFLVPSASLQGTKMEFEISNQIKRVEKRRMEKKKATIRYKT